MQLLVGSNAPGINKSGYSNPLVNRWYDKLRATTDIDEKIQYINLIEEQVLKDLPWIPLMYESSYVLLNPRLQNYRKSSMVRNFVKYLKFKQVK